MRPDEEDEFDAIVGGIENVEDRWYRQRALTAGLVLLFGAAVAGLCWLAWGSGWGAVIGLPLMIGADVAWILTLRRLRRWRRSAEPPTERP